MVHIIEQPVRKMLSVSSAHICKATADWLNLQGEINAASHHTGRAAPVHVASHGYGWILYCGEVFGDYPADLAGLLAWARDKHGCDYVDIDSDGVDYDDLEQYDW